MKKLFFTFFVATLSVVSAFADCTETISNFRLGDTKFSDGFNYDDKIKEYTTNLNSPIVSFSYNKASSAATRIEWRIDEKINNQWVENFKTENGSGTATVELSRETRTFRFVYSGNFAGDFSNIKITQASYLEIPTDEIDFGVIEEGNSAPNKSIKIDYSAIENNLTASVSTGVFSIDKTKIASADCSYGTTTLNVSFKPTQLGIFSDEIAFSNGTTVVVKGEYSRRINTELRVVNDKYTSIGLAWDKVPDATAYRIVNNTTGLSYLVEGSATEYNVTGLKTNTSYSFTLYAIFNGATSINSSNTVTAKTKESALPLQDCVVYEYNDSKRFTASTDEKIEYDLKKGNSNSLKYTKRVEFEAKMEDTKILVTYPATVGENGDMRLLVKVEGEKDYRETWYWNAEDAKITKEFKKFVAEIPYNTVAIKFETGFFNGGCYRYVKNLKVYKDKILESDVYELDFGKVKPNESITKTFNITYSQAVVLSEITYENPIKAVIGDGLGFYKVEYKDEDACAEGEQTVSVTFTPINCTENYNATLALLNGEYIEIKLKGELIRNSEIVNEIIWSGIDDSNWDNRKNWLKTDGNVLSAADVLASDLIVTLPAGKDRYPVLPDVSTYEAFKTVRDKECNCAQVNAGDNETATMVADKIYMEYGAALVGVENLNKGTSRYREVEMEFTPKRYNEITKCYDWSLVGPVVKPWDDENPGQTRDVISRDYYLNYLPHVYMHEAKVSDDYEISWNESFPNLDVKLPNNKAFAIRLPNQYGRNDKGKGLPAAVYNRRNETSYNPTDLITFHFKGRFYNEAELPKYTGLETGKPVLLNNTYPANINAYELQKGNGTIVYYDYDNKSFVPVGDNKDAVIMSQHGFMFTASNDGDLIVSQSCMQNTATGERSAEEEIQGLRLQIANEDKALASEIFVRYDYLKEDNVDYKFDSPKVFNKMEPELPDMYAIRYNSKWAGLTVPTLEKQIPLGIKVSASDQVFIISLKNSNLPYDILLEDRSTGNVYNLSEGEKCVVEGLGIDDYEGRFYLGTSESDISTDIEEKVEESATIDVFTRGKTIVVSADAGVELDYVELVDMSGSKEIYELEGGHYEEIPAIVPAGIYVVKVVADKTSVVTKVKLN